MADNFVTDPGALGITFASDDISSVHYPITKLGFGALDSVDLASSGTGTDDAGTLRVTLATDIDLPTGPVTNTGTFVVQIDGDALTALQLIDDVVVTLGTDTYTETTTKANVIAVVRNDVLATLAGTDNELTPLQVDEHGALWVSEEPNLVDATNSSTTPLAGDAVFTGTATDVLEFSAITMNVDSDVDSATDGIQIQLSSDGTNWDFSRNFTYTAANGGAAFQLATAAQFFRVIYTNGSGAQATFRLQCILHHTTPITGTHRLVDSEDPDSYTTLVKAAVVAQAAGSGDFVPVQATAVGNLKMSIEEVDGSIAGGGVEATALRVTIANDSTGLLSVDDNGASLTTDTAGDIAHDAVDSGNPVKVGAIASNSIEGRTQVANADRTDAVADLNGVLLQRPHTTLEEAIAERDSITSGTSTAFAGAFAAPGAGNHLYVTAMSVANTSSTDTFIDFQDGASGTVIWTMSLPANGGANMTFPVPLKVADNTALAYQIGTGVSTAFISVSGFTAQG